MTDGMSLCTDSTNLFDESYIDGSAGYVKIPHAYFLCRMALAFTSAACVDVRHHDAALTVVLLHAEMPALSASTDFEVILLIP